MFILCTVRMAVMAVEGSRGPIVTLFLSGHTRICVAKDKTEDALSSNSLRECMTVLYATNLASQKGTRACERTMYERNVHIHFVG